MATVRPIIPRLAALGRSAPRQPDLLRDCGRLRRPGSDGDAGRPGSQQAGCRPTKPSLSHSYVFSSLPSYGPVGAFSLVVVAAAHLKDLPYLLGSAFPYLEQGNGFSAGERML
ncbi:hypothetical protein DL771_005423 [Monosporascus sp. 5C6A]|nr:hypothetical protein DL771_005423 [Monosporascus sp. 5C6A]